MYWDHTYLREKNVSSLHGVTISIYMRSNTVAVKYANHKTFFSNKDSGPLKSRVGTDLRYEWFEYICQQSCCLKSKKQSRPRWGLYAQFLTLQTKNANR